MMIWGMIFTTLLMLFSLILLDLFHVVYEGRAFIYGACYMNLALMFLMLFIEQRVSTEISSLLFTIIVFIVMILSDKPIEFLQGQSIIFLVLPVVMAGLLLRPWAGYIVAAIVIIGEVAGYFIYHTGLPNIAAYILIFILAWIVQQATSSLERAVEQQEQKARELQASQEAVRSQNERIEEISRKLIEVQEREKHLLAAELHDDLGQSLTSLKLMLELIGSSASSGRQQKINEARELASELMQKVRNLSLDLRPAMLDDFGLFPALRWLIERFKAQAGLSVTCRFDVDAKERFDAHVETAAFRIIQEALTNVARHASVQEALITLSANDSLQIEVVDQGKGFDMSKRSLAAPDCAGLSGMEERARLLGGSLQVISQPGCGTRILAKIPLKANT